MPDVRQGLPKLRNRVAMLDGLVAAIEFGFVTRQIEIHRELRRTLRLLRVQGDREKRRACGNREHHNAPYMLCAGPGHPRPYTVEGVLSVGLAVVPMVLIRC